MTTSAPTTPPAPAPGSAASFALLYCPRPFAHAARALLALSDEIGAARTRALDPQVAHLRLQWWAEEIARYRSGRAEHPWLRDPRLRPERPLALEVLLDAATSDLHAAPGDSALPAAVFTAWARLAGASVDADTARALSALMRGLPSAPVSVASAEQPALAPLLVWTSVGHRQCARHAAGFADQFSAWRAARLAYRGRWIAPQP